MVVLNSLELLGKMMFNSNEMARGELSIQHGLTLSPGVYMLSVKSGAVVQSFMVSLK